MHGPPHFAGSVSTGTTPSWSPNQSVPGLTCVDCINGDIEVRMTATRMTFGSWFLTAFTAIHGRMSIASGLPRGSGCTLTDTTSVAEAPSLSVTVTWIVREPTVQYVWSSERAPGV